MKKPLILCTVILLLTLSLLAIVNCAYDSIDRIEADKRVIQIEKPDTISNMQFLLEVDQELKKHNIDIMFRYIELCEEKPHYKYYITNNTSDFISVEINLNSSNGKVHSTGDEYKNLPLSDLFQDISIYDWYAAESYDLSLCSYYVLAEDCAEAAATIQKLGYTISIGTELYISPKFSVLVYAFLPAIMLTFSMVFYSIENAKKNMLKKMEGFSPGDVFESEVREVLPVILKVAAFIGIIFILFSAVLFPRAYQHIALFGLCYALIFLLILAVAALTAFLVMCAQRNVLYIKGKVPRRGIYVTVNIVKCLFLGFVLFFLTIALRNLFACWTTYQAAAAMSDKLKGYVTVPVNISNSSADGLNDNYRVFYDLTVDLYGGILIDSSNYSYDLLSGSNAAETYGQDSITINANYLLFNPVYDLDGNKITKDMLSKEKYNILLPASKINKMKEYTEYVALAFSKEANFIVYDNKATTVYSCCADTVTNGSGTIDSPVILIFDEGIQSMFLYGYCSMGYYFLEPGGNDPYATLYPLLVEAGIEKTTLETPYISTSYSELITQQKQMLWLYGSETVLQLIAIICLVFFTANVYCENNRLKLTCKLIDGYTLGSIIWGHLLLVALSYTIVTFALHKVQDFVGVNLNMGIVLILFLWEIGLTFLGCKKYAMAKLYELMKGAE